MCRNMHLLFIVGVRPELVSAMATMAEVCVYIGNLVQKV